MSSELIGELGQVGLTVGVSPHKREHSDTDSSHNENRSRSSSSSSHKPKRFRQAWMMFDIFKDWLRPHTNPEFAICIVCNRVIKAGKSELEKHAAGKKHVKQLQQYQNIVYVENMSSDLTGTFTLNESAEMKFNSSRDEAELGEAEEFLVTHNSATNTTEVIPQPLPTYQIRRNCPPDQSTASVQNIKDMNTCKAFVMCPAPQWKATAIVNGHVTKLELTDYRDRYLVLFFYPQDFSKLCATEINSLSDKANDFRRLGAEVVACSTDSHLSHLAWIKRDRIEGGVMNTKIPLLCDPTHQISKDYGVYMPDKGHCLRGHFIIDKRSVIRHMQINDISIGRKIDELLRFINALIFHDETEQGCPADWTPSESSES